MLNQSTTFDLYLMVSMDMIKENERKMKQNLFQHQFEWTNMVKYPLFKKE